MVFSQRLTLSTVNVALSVARVAVLSSLPVALAAVLLECLPGGGALKGFMSYTGSFGGGLDSTSKNFTNNSEKDWNRKQVFFFRKCHETAITLLTQANVTFHVQHLLWHQYKKTKNKKNKKKTTCVKTHIV